MNRVSGHSSLSDKLSSYIKKAENSQDILVEAAKVYVADVRRQPKPMSKIRKSGYTHLVHDIDFRKADNGEVEVGSRTKYYLRFVEIGTNKMSGRFFLRNLYHQNKSKYIQIMLKALER